MQTLKALLDTAVKNKGIFFPSEDAFLSSFQEAFEEKISQISEKWPVT